jgi:ATP-binding cassette subfamily B protein
MKEEKILLGDRWKELKTTFRTTHRLLGLLWDIDKDIFWGSVITAIVPAITPFINAYIYKLIIDLVVRSAGSSQFDYRYLAFLIALRLLTYIIQTVFTSAQSSFEQLLWLKFPIAFYQRVLDKISSLDVEYFENSAFKNKLQKVADSYQYRPLNMLDYSFNTFQNVLSFVIAIALIAHLSWELGILILFSAVPSFFNQLTNARRIWSLWDGNTEQRKKIYYISDLLQDDMNIKEIKLFGVAPRLLAEFKKIFADFFAENLDLVKRQFKQIGVLNIFTAMIVVSIETSIIVFAARGTITIGDVTYYTTILLGFATATNGLFRNIANLFDTSQYVKEVFSIFDVTPKVVSPANAVKLSFTAPPKIEFKNVSFTYPGSTGKVYDDFSLIIQPGEKIAFVGENGAGKTTFVKLLARFYDVDKGEILINDVNIKQLDLVSWYSALGVLFQDFVRYEYSVKDNIFFGDVLALEKIHDIYHAAELSGAASFIERLRGKYNQMLGKTFENGIDLSTGQWQKIALARAFFRNAPVLILDEPTAAIDAKAESEIFEHVEELSKGKTVLIISHRFSTVKSADIICVIDKGRIIEQGKHKELMKKKGTYATLFNLQAKAYQETPGKDE